MAAVEVSPRHSAALPPMNLIDMAPVKREDRDAHKKQDSLVSASGTCTPYSPAASRPSLTGLQHHASAHGPAALASHLSPPDARRTSADDKDQSQPAKLSLPSIHEALNSEQRYPPPQNLHAPTSAPSSAPLHYHHSHAASPSEVSHRPFAPELSQPGPVYPAAVSQSYANPTSATSGTPRPGPSDSFSRPSFTPTGHASRLPSLHLRTMDSPIEASRPPPCYGSHHPSAPESGSHSAGNLPYGYVGAHSHPNHPYSAPSQATPGPHFAPTSTYPAPPRYRDAWRPEDANNVEEMKKNGRQPGAVYGESVKRHLDNFDLEASLNEIAEGSGRILDFSRSYGARATQTAQRMGPTHVSIPSMTEVDGLLIQSTRIQDCLKRIQHLIHTQQTVMAEKAQDQRYHAMNNGYEEPNQGPYTDDQKRVGDFAGPDPKKRRGRAAPPGRCHSCNRAETPEWRRGPDGARTLCNACGLHYAKLTRKMGTNKTAIGNSNLRPKSVGPSSPGS